MTDDSAAEAGEDAVEHDAPAAPDGAEDAAADPSPGALRLYGDLLALSNPVYLPVGR